MARSVKGLAFATAAVWVCLLAAGCGQAGDNAADLEIPRGYMAQIRVEHGDRVFGFGPFVGYYFRPETPGDFTRLQFVCFNERSFYTRDLPENTRLFEGTAVLTRLPESDFEIPASGRINPVYFSEAPVQWIESRPAPKDEFLHFHSCYDARGAVLTGYWFRHAAAAEFIYDMGGRVGPDSPLYHEVLQGVDRGFARIIEFDHGPE